MRQTLRQTLPPRPGQQKVAQLLAIGARLQWRWRLKGLLLDPKGNRCGQANRLIRLCFATLVG